MFDITESMLVTLATSASLFVVLRVCYSTYQSLDLSLRSPMQQLLVTKSPDIQRRVSSDI